MWKIASRTFLAHRIPVCFGVFYFSILLLVLIDLICVYNGKTISAWYWSTNDDRDRDTAADNIRK